MSSRLRRPPSGRCNLQQEVPLSARTPRALPTPRVASSSPRVSPVQKRPETGSARRQSNSQCSASRQSQSTYGQVPSVAKLVDALSSHRTQNDDCIVICSDRSDINTREVLTRLRNKHADEERRKAAEETLLMSDYNPFSRPRPSTAIPLRSAFLDPETNNFYPSKTRSELMQRIKLASMPHPSYDIDGDGWVSQEDYKLAKRFDFDGNGVIDPHEKRIAKAVMTDEFFKAHKENLHVFGEKIANASHAENVNAVVNSSNFERTFGLLKGVEDSLKGRASKEMLGCMDTVHKNLTKHNFFTNKFDTTAWNDFDAIPRGGQPLDELSHNGSRRRLMEARKARSRLDGNKFNQQASTKEKTLRNHRIALISNFALEN